jgi:hypothetical protein
LLPQGILVVREPREIRWFRERRPAKRSEVQHAVEIARERDEVQRHPNGQAARAKAALVIRLDAEGLQCTEIARRRQIGIASVYRILTVARMGAVEREVAA